LGKRDVVPKSLPKHSKGYRKSSKAQTHGSFHKVPALRSDEQELTSFSGLVVFQVLFDHLWLKLRFEGCFAHLKSSCVFRHHRHCVAFHRPLPAWVQTPERRRLLLRRPAHETNAWPPCRGTRSGCPVRCPM